MDLTKVLLELHQELDHLDAAIVCLERLQNSHPRLQDPPKAPRTARKRREAPKARVVTTKLHAG